LRSGLVRTCNDVSVYLYSAHITTYAVMIALKKMLHQEVPLKIKNPNNLFFCSNKTGTVDGLPMHAQAITLIISP